MKNSPPKIILHRLATLAATVCLLCASNLRAAFVYETSNEFLTSGDFNGDGLADVLLLDKTTGNARVGYSDGAGHLIWSAPLVTSVDNVSGCAVGRFKLTTRDALVVTAPTLNRFQLYDLLNTNASVSLGSSTQSGLGPHSLASLTSPFGSPPPPFSTLLVASSFNNAPAEELDIVTNFPIGFASSAGQYPETGSFERANDVPITTNGPTFAAGIVRGTTNDALHLWQFTNAPSMIPALTNLPPGSDYVLGNFNAEPLPRFIVYQPGGTNLSIYQLIQTNSGFIFGPATVATASEPVQQVFYLQTGSSGSAVLVFGDGIQGMGLPGGVPGFSVKYTVGTGAAGNVFTGIAPLANGQFTLFDAPPGNANSTHDQVISFDGLSFTQLSATNLPALSSKTTRANVWLFQLEPFVYRDAGYVASVNASDWSDSVSGLPGAFNVVRESDAGTNSGLGSAATSNLGAPPTGATNGLPNQYNPAISVFTYSAPHAAEPASILISPPPGPYGGPITISLAWPGTGRQAFYRVTPGGTWQSYSAPFPLTNNATIQYYGGTLLSPARSQIQLASYTFGGPSVTGTNSPILINPGNSNTVVVFSTNQLTISPNGTVFYGRRSAANLGTIWAINLDGSSDTYLTTGVRPRVTRDGRWLAFLREGNPFGNQGNVWIRDLLSGTETRLFTNPNYIVGYDWETNAAALLMDYSCGIVDLNTNGTLTSIINSNCLDEAPVRNPVDGRIAFHNLSVTGSTYGIYLTAANGSARQRIVSNVPGASWPAWSPDGGDLVFADGNNTNANSGKNLWLVYPDGTGLLQISGFTDATNGFPHGAIWAPDDSTLVAAGTIFQTNGLWLIPLTPDHSECDGAPILLPTSPGDAIDFAGSIVVAQSPTVAMPGLFIRLEPTTTVVYWSTNYDGFLLEYTTNLVGNIAWTDITGPYFLNGGYYEYHEAKPPLASQKFFRLRYPGVFFLTPSSPQIAVQSGSGQTTLNWPADYVGYSLESTTNLNAPAVWTPVSGTYGITNGQFEFRQNLPSPKPREFFRLRWP